MEQPLQQSLTISPGKSFEFPVKLIKTWRLWRQRARERAQLAAMSPGQWKDIGLTTMDARQEINKARWKP